MRIRPFFGTHTPDHALLVAETDAELIDVIDRTGWKHALLPRDTTAENLYGYILDYLSGPAGEVVRTHRLEEIETCYAEAACSVTPAGRRMAAGFDVEAGQR